MTFSIAARCAETGMMGCAVASSAIAVSARCAHARAKVGAVLSQNITDPRLGPAILDRIAAGDTADIALRTVQEDHADADWRQILVADHAGGVAHLTGSRVAPRHAVATGKGCVAGGAMLASGHVPEHMIKNFEAMDGPLALRLIAALESGLEAGGESRPIGSAGVLVAYEESWPFVDLRIDWDEDPVTRLRELWYVYQPQAADFVLRANDPREAPSVTERLF